MRKISNILLLIGGIYAIVCAATFFIFSIVCFAGGATAFISKQITEWLHEAGVDDPDRVKMIIGICSMTAGATLLVCAILSIPSAVVSFLARKKPVKGLLIANIVLGYLVGTTYNVVGGILGLIYNHKLAKKNAQSNVVDVQ